MSDRSRNVAASLAVALVALVFSLAGLDARATYGARVSADEPQYLLTAISLGEDVDLDVSDEITEERFRPFHEVGLNPQTIELDETGRQVSPHDPLLPLILALPMRLGGWVAAKATLAVFAAVVAVLTLRLATTRLAAPLGTATAVVAGFAAAPPFSVYGTQVYPAMPAALAVLVGVLAVTAGGRNGRGTDRAAWLAVASVVALPWLSVKYVPVAAVIAGAGLLRSRRLDGRWPRAVIGWYLVAGLAYLGLHHWWYGGWTVYAAGDHFVDGEWRVIGSNPNYPGRSRRLVGLLVDRTYGLVAWNPAFLAVPAAVVALLRSRIEARWVVLAVVATGWAVATWVALTMHGWWWPGRQVVPVLPLAVAAIAALVARHRRLAIVIVGACAVGAAGWLFLAWEASTDRRVLIVDMEETANPWYQFWRGLLPDHRRMANLDVVTTTIWSVVLIVSTVPWWRRAPQPAAADTVDETSPAQLDEAVAVD